MILKELNSSSELELQHLRNTLFLDIVELTTIIQQDRSFVAASIQDGTTRKAASVSALSLSSRDSESTPSSSKDASQYPSTMTLVTNPNTLTDTKPLPLQEPDVIASTKNSCSRNNVPQDQPKQDAPVAPPRRKKKNVKNSVSSLSLVVSISVPVH